MLINSDFVELQEKEPQMNYDTLLGKEIATYKMGEFEKQLIEEIKKEDDFYKKLKFESVIVEQPKNKIYKCLKDNLGNYFEL